MGRPSELAGAPVTLRINGRDIHEFGMILYNTAHLNMGGAIFPQETVPGRHGALAFQGQFQAITLLLQGVFIANTPSGLHTNIDAAKAELRALKGKNFDRLSPLRLVFAGQTDRYYPCALAGDLVITPLTYRFQDGEGAGFSLPLVVLNPFALSTEETVVSPTATGPSFEVLEAGTAPCYATIDFKGASGGTVTFSLSDVSFLAEFNWNLTAKAIDGTDLSGTTGAATPANQFEPGAYGFRFIQQSGFQTYWSSVIQNPSQGFWAVAIRPQFAYNTAANKWLVHHYIDASNDFALYYDATFDRFMVRRNASGVQAAGSGGAAQTFAPDAAMVIAGSYGPAGMKIYKDGALLDSNAVTTGYAGASGTVYFGNQAGTATPDCKYERVLALPYQPSDADVARICANWQDAEAFNVKRTRTGGALGASERCVMEFEYGKVSKYTSALSASNDVPNWDSGEFPILRPPKMCFYVPSGTSFDAIKIRYRKAWL